MKKNIVEFIRRGLVAWGFGPLVLVIIYLILQSFGAVETLTVHEVCVGILSLSALAFVAGGMNVIYQVEQLPLMLAILIHGGVLYICYLLTYLINGWLEWGMIPVLVFTGIFIVGYLVIWGIISAIMREKITAVNEALKQKQLTEL